MEVALPLPRTAASVGVRSFSSARFHDNSGKGARYRTKERHFRKYLV